MGGAMLCWTGAETYYYAFLVDLRNPPYPSYSDALWLGAYAGTVLGLLALMHARLRNFRIEMAIDTAVGGLAIATVGAAVLIGPIIADTQGTLAATATNIAYPLFDVLIVSLALGAFVMSNGRPGRGWVVLGAVFAAQCVSDTFYLYQNATGTYQFGGLLDVTWPVYMLVIALVAWQRPAVTKGSERQGWPSLAVTSGFALVGLSLMAYDHWHRLNDVAVFLAPLTLVAAFVRTAMTFADMRTRDARLLARSRELLESNELVLNAAGEGICGLDPTGQITFVNPAAARLTGYEPAELVGRSLHTVVHHTRADGSAYAFAESPVAATLRDGTVHHGDRDQ
jgi:PAS domain-containing protein